MDADSIAHLRNRSLALGVLFHANLSAQVFAVRTDSDQAKLVSLGIARQLRRPTRASSMAKAAADPDRGREPLSGLVERVTFHSAETGFCVLRVKVRGHPDLVTVLGSAAEVHAGESIQASGQWQQHRDYGLQFRASFLQVCHRLRSRALSATLDPG